MVSLFTQFTTGCVIQVPETDPRLLSHQETPAVLTSDDEPAAQLSDPQATAPETDQQVSQATGTTASGDGTSSPQQ